MMLPNARKHTFGYMLLTVTMTINGCGPEVKVAPSTTLHTLGSGAPPPGLSNAPGILTAPGLSSAPGLGNAPGDPPVAHRPTPTPVPTPTSTPGPTPTPTSTPTPTPTPGPAAGT